MKFQRSAALALTAFLALGMAVEAAAQDGAARPPATIWRFLGIPQGLHKIRDVTSNRRGNHPRLERKPPRLGIADPANLESKNPAIKKAAEIKMEEDLAPQKIKALKYLAKIGCGCYPGVKEALMAALDDCTEKVRYEAAQQIGEAAGDLCEVCSKKCCCDEELTKKLAEVAYERDDEGCWLEVSERVRQAAAEALRICCPATGPPVYEGEVIPDETIPTTPPGETIPFDPPPPPPGEESVDGRSARAGLARSLASDGFSTTIEGEDDSLTVIQVVPAGSAGRAHASRSAHSAHDRAVTDRWLAEFSRPDHQPSRSSAGLPNWLRYRAKAPAAAVALDRAPGSDGPSAVSTSASSWAPRDRAPIPTAAHDRGPVPVDSGPVPGDSAPTPARRATDAVPAGTLTRRASERPLPPTLTRRASERPVAPATRPASDYASFGASERPVAPATRRDSDYASSGPSDATLTRRASERPLPPTLTRRASERPLPSATALARRGSEENELSLSLGPAVPVAPAPGPSAGERPQAATLTRRASERPVASATRPAGEATSSSPAGQQSSLSISLGPATSVRPEVDRAAAPVQPGWKSSRITVIEAPAAAASRTSVKPIESPRPAPESTVPATLKIDISPPLSPSELEEAVPPKVTRRAAKSVEPASSASGSSFNEIRLTDPRPAPAVVPPPAAPQAAQVIWIDDE